MTSHTRTCLSHSHTDWQYGRITVSAQVWRVGIEATHGGNPASPDTTQEGDIAIDDVRLLWPSCESTLLASHKSHVPYMYDQLSSMRAETVVF